MIQNPFASWAPFEDRVETRWCTRTDAVRSDDDLSALLGPAFSTVKQPHGILTVAVREPGSRDDPADGMVTANKGLFLAVRAADCQLFGIFDPTRNVIGAVHIGWRCLVAGGIAAFFRAARELHGVEATDAYVVATPSLCQACAEFTDPSRELPGIDARFFDGRNVDLRGAADEQLFSLGVRSDRLERHPACTKCERDAYWSYRGDAQSVNGGYRNVLALRILP